MEMYGLGSRDALSKRQSRWAQDLEKDVRNNPAQNVFIREQSSNRVRDKPNIITLMNEEDQQIETTKKIQALYIENSSSLVDLQQRCLKLEQTCESLQLIISEKSQENISEKSQMNIRIQSLEDSRVASLISNSISTRGSLGNSLLSTIIEDPSNFSALTEPDIRGSYDFIPYIIKEDYAGCDNKTTLNGTNMEMLVEMLNSYKETLIIYPFGVEINLPQFLSVNVKLQLYDSDGNDIGIINGLFRRRTNSIYIIDISESERVIGRGLFPIQMTCKVDLVVE